jgi:hypothetical protein
MNEGTPLQALPDHPFRRSIIWQMFDRGWRPAMYWFATMGVAYVCFIGHWIGRPMDMGYAVQVLLFAGGVAGIKTFEKMKGVA